MKMVYTVKGFQIATVEQARTMLLVLMLKRDTAGADEAYRVLKALEGAAK
jgi:hypothetical protein